MLNSSSARRVRGHERLRRAIRSRSIADRRERVAQELLRVEAGAALAEVVPARQHEVERAP